MLFPILRFLTVDTDALGKCHPGSLTEQQRLELLVADMYARTTFQNADHEFLDYTEWQHIELHNDKTVRAIQWGIAGALFFQHKTFIQKGGSIDFQWIPLHVEVFEASGLLLHGSIETSLLPQNLNRLSAARNLLTGTFDMSGLPPLVETVYIHRNSLGGTLDFQAIPPRLSVLFAYGNAFIGGIDLSSARGNLHMVDLQHNALTGPVQLDGVRSIGHLNIEENKFQQKSLRIPFTEAEAEGVLLFDETQFGEVIYDAQLCSCSQRKL